MQPCLRQAQAVHARIHIADPDFVDDEVGCGIVAQDDHEQGRVADRQRMRRAEELQNPAAWTLVRGEHDQRIVQFDGAAFNVMEKLDQNRYLDHTRARELLPAVNRQRFPTRQILNVKPDYAMMAGNPFFEGRAEFA